MQKYHLFYDQLPWQEPKKIFPALFGGKKNTFWLEGKKYSYTGSSVKSINYTLSNHTLSITNNNKTRKDVPSGTSQKLNRDIFTYLKEELSDLQIIYPPLSRGGREDFTALPFDFVGGYVGCLSYEMDAHLLFVDKFLAFDHQNKTLTLISVSEKKETSSLWFSSIKKLLTNSPIKIPHTPPDKTKSLTFTISKNHKQYLKDIKACQKYLRAGDAYQICLTNQISINIKTNWLDLYLALRQTNPAPYNAYLNFDGFALLSSSPEQFLRIDKKRYVYSKPMKGTVRRGKTVHEDKKLAYNLGKTKKDFAENMMIVDLVRNDLGKICEIGSVKVENPLSIETYATVHQLVSTIKGKLNKDMTAIDAFQAAFPGGSMTGTPKKRACEIISEIEKNPRGIYSGCFGYLSLNGTANLAMTIRTIIATPDKLTFGTGGAILTDSIPSHEYNEMLLKTKALITSIMKTTGAKNYTIIDTYGKILFTYTNEEKNIFKKYENKTPKK